MEVEEIAGPEEGARGSTDALETGSEKRGAKDGPLLVVVMVCLSS